MARYETTAASVIATGMEESYDPEDATTTYYLSITYRYNVRGQDYMNDRFSQQPVSTSHFITQKVLDKHPVGSQIEIFYNVDDPTVSFVEKGFGKTNTRIMIVVLVFAIIFIVAMFAFVLYITTL